jgi:hypothetical protein
MVQESASTARRAMVVINTGVRFRKRGETIDLGRIGRISVLKCCAGSRLGYQGEDAEADQSADLPKGLSWLLGGGLAGCQWAEGGSLWTSGGQLEKDAHTGWHVSGFAESRRRRWDGRPRRRRDSVGVGVGVGLGSALGLGG